MRWGVQADVISIAYTITLLIIYRAILLSFALTLASMDAADGPRI